LRNRTLLAIAAPILGTFALVSSVPHARAQQSDPTPAPAILTSAPDAPSDTITPAIVPQQAAPPTASPTEPEAPPAPPADIPSSGQQSTTPAGEPAVQAPVEEPSAENPAAQAGDPEFRSALAAAIPVEPAAYDTEPYRLRLHNTHTLEDIDIVYRVGDNYQPEAIARLNYFLRDHYTNDVIAYDPREFDLLHDVLVRLRRPGATIDVVCGYRTQETNELLRASSRGVAEHSQHILGHAIDIQIPGSTTVRIRNAALSLNEGGVGYYPTTHFVHVDVGAIRTWTFAPHRYHHRRGHLRRVSTHHRQIAQHHRHTTRAAGM
jgi:uncharacterized protein YcbK (DUF882 family)